MKADRAWLLTPPGPGAIAVIRWSGASAIDLLKQFFSKPLRQARCVHGELCDESGTVIDDPVIVLIDDQTADINVHGGGAIIRAVLSLAQRAGLSLEPPPLDCLAGNLIDQEANAALPLARTQLGLAALLAQPRAWAAARWTIDRIQQTLADHSMHSLLYPPKVAIIGLPNVGKSTLANQLFGRDRSIVFNQPGTTRDWVDDFADIDGLPILLMDTPGIRETSDEIELAAIARSREEAVAAELVVFVLDLTQPRSPQLQLQADFPDALCVINKSDLPPIWNPDESQSYRVVATDGQGIDALRAAIRCHFLGEYWELNRPRAWTQRQRQWLEDATPVIA